MDYKKLDNKDIESLKSIIGDEKRVIFDNINEEYSHDELSGTRRYPEIVLRAKTTEEVSKIMKYAYENNIPVTPRGAGTGLVGACVPIKEGILIDLTLMNNILELSVASWR